MSTRLPQPFRYRNRWRAQVTLQNGERPSQDFDTFAQAKAWIADMLANSNTENEPLLGGPTQARLADMLDHYVRTTTLAKGGAVQEINRANHYLAAAGLPELALWERADGTKEIVTLARKHAMRREECGDTAAVTPQKRRGPRSEAGVLPSGFAQHNEARSRASHPRTYELYATLANKRASQITGADMRVLHTTMTAEGYSASTIQKEIALLKALFNESQNWHWPIARNPCAGIQLKQGNRRFVVFTDEQRVRLTEALAQCDNPRIWPLVDFTMETALRQSTLLRLRWEDVSFEDRKVHSLGKGQLSFIPLSKRAVQILEGMPGPHEGLIFPLSAESIRQAWTRIRERAGLTKLLFRDLRHIAPTSYARAGMNTFQIRDILGHKTTTQADIYVNLANRDILDAMDRIDATVQVALPLPPETSDWDALRGQNKTRRLKKVDIPLVVVEHDKAGESVSMAAAHAPATAPAPAEKPFMAARLADNVIPFKRRSPSEQPTSTTAPVSPPLLQQHGS
jgi:integrase